MQLRSSAHRPIADNQPDCFRSSTTVSPVNVDMLQQGKNNSDRYPQGAYTEPSTILEELWLVAQLQTQQ